VLHGAKPVTITATRCRDCESMRQLADAIVTDHLGLAARLGRDSAKHRLECALGGLAVLGLPVTAPTTEAEALALIRHLGVPGHTTRWLSRFTPTLAADAQLNTCSPHPWAHVRIGQRAALRQGYAALLKERVASGGPPVRCPHRRCPPSPRPRPPGVSSPWGAPV